MLKQFLELAEALPEPFILVSRQGETIESNGAFRALAERTGTGPRLLDLFGDAFSDLLAQALREGSARDSLPLAVGNEPLCWFRLSITAPAGRDSLAVVLVDVSEEMAWRRKLLDRAWDLAVIKDIGAALSGAVELDELTEHIYEQTTRVVHTENFFIALHDRETGIVSFPRYIEEGRWQGMTSRPFGNGLCEHVLRTGRPLLLNRDVREQAVTLGIEPMGRPSKAWIGVPIGSDGETIGVIALQDYDRSDVYDQHDLEFLSIIAGQAAAAIKNARLLAQARAAYQELSEAQARLLEAERVRGVTETVGALNHEVNNPLAAIAGNAQLLMRRADLVSPDGRAKIASILESAQRIQQVTAKMSTLIQATSMPYPGQDAILDVHRSVSRGDASQLFPPVQGRPRD